AGSVLERVLKMPSERERSPLAADGTRHSWALRPGTGRAPPRKRHFQNTLLELKWVSLNSEAGSDRTPSQQSRNSRMYDDAIDPGNVAKKCRRELARHSAWAPKSRVRPCLFVVHCSWHIALRL